MNHLRTALFVALFVLSLATAHNALAACPAAVPVLSELTCSSTFDGRITGATASNLGGSCGTADCYSCGTPYSTLEQPFGDHVYSFECQASGSVTLMVHNLDCDLDIYILDDTCDPYSGCQAGATNASTTSDQVTFTCLAGRTYYISVEGYGYTNPYSEPGKCNGAEGNYTLSFDVSAASGCPEDCNNGIDDDFDGDIDCFDSDCSGDPVCTCDNDGDSFEGSLYAWCFGSDCDDTNSDIYPGAPESADGTDQDCDGTVDETTEWYDDDGDGYTEVGGDCDDDDATIHPSALEICDGIDQDCDGIIDEETDCYDDDGDGYSEDDGDCNDGDSSVYPGAIEDISNNVDDDCDGVVDSSAYDPDGDGYLGSAGDCDETNGTVYPGAPELPDGLDNDCDGLIDEGTVLYDDDGDGETEAEGDCNDDDTSIHTGAEEVPDGVDNDCDGMVDEGTDLYDDDGDGFSEEGGDCDDTNDEIHPGALEYQNGIDDDCDGLIDETNTDADSDGFTVADGDCDDTDGWVHPEMDEMCDGIDNDCNGRADEGCPVSDEGTLDQSYCGCNNATPLRSAWIWILGLAMFATQRKKIRVQL